MNGRMVSIALALFIVVAAGRSARADVGQCWVMFAYMPADHKDHLNMKQQQEIGERLTTAHMSSNGSDRHVVFLCYINSSEPELVYHITEPKEKLHPASEMYRITARDFTAMREAIAVVEQELKGGPPLPRIRKTTPEKARR